MKVLVGCEESQAVCIEFRKRGHEAFSCDLQECSGGHPEWHIQGDVLEVINGGAFPLGNSICIAAYDLGFDLDWMELDVDYYKAALSRYESHVAKYAPANDIPVNKQGQHKLF